MRVRRESDCEENAAAYLQPATDPGTRAHGATRPTRSFSNGTWENLISVHYWLLNFSTLWNVNINTKDLTYLTQIANNKWTNEISVKGWRATNLIQNSSGYKADHSLLSTLTNIRRSSQCVKPVYKTSLMTCLDNKCEEITTNVTNFLEKSS